MDFKINENTTKAITIVVICGALTTCGFLEYFDKQKQADVAIECAKAGKKYSIDMVGHRPRCE